MILRSLTWANGSVSVTYFCVCVSLSLSDGSGLSLRYKIDLTETAADQSLENPGGSVGHFCPS